DEVRYVLVKDAVAGAEPDTINGRTHAELDGTLNQKGAVDLTHATGLDAGVIFSIVEQNAPRIGQDDEYGNGEQCAQREPWNVLADGRPIEQQENKTAGDGADKAAA